LINEKLNIIYSTFDREKEFISEERKNLIILMEVVWDDVKGPTTENYFPKDIELDFPIDKIGGQLYDIISSIYGQDYIKRSEGLLLPVQNFHIMAYVFFDSYPDKSFRGETRDYMLSLLAPKITFFQSLIIKQVFLELSSLYKKQKGWDIEGYWNRFSDILLKPLI
jgi:hypothetical protein